jgi:hypothetical protein
MGKADHPRISKLGFGSPVCLIVRREGHPNRDTPLFGPLSANPARNSIHTTAKQPARLRVLRIFLAACEFSSSRILVCVMITSQGERLQDSHGALGQLLTGGVK